MWGGGPTSWSTYQAEKHARLISNKRNRMLLSLVSSVCIVPRAEKQAVGGIPQRGYVKDQVGRDRHHPHQRRLYRMLPWSPFFL